MSEHPSPEAHQEESSASFNQQSSELKPVEKGSIDDHKTVSEEHIPNITPEEFAKLQQVGQRHIDPLGRVRSVDNDESDPGASLRSTREWQSRSGPVERLVKYLVGVNDRARSLIRSKRTDPDAENKAKDLYKHLTWLSDQTSSVKIKTMLTLNADDETTLSNIEGRTQDLFKLLLREFPDADKSVATPIATATASAVDIDHTPTGAHYLDIFKKIETAGAYQLTKESNPVLSEFDKLDEAVKELRTLGLTPEKLSEIEYDVARLKFVVLKGSIIKTYKKTEFNEDSAETMDGIFRDVISPLLDRLRTVTNHQVPDVIPLTRTVQKAAFIQELSRFEKETVTVIMFYLAAKAIRGTALGLTASTGVDTEPMKLPSTMSVFIQGFDNSNFATLLKPGGLGKCSEEALCSTEEYDTTGGARRIKEVNPTIGTRRVKVYDVNSANEVEKDVQVTAWGECMRLLDMFFAGTPPSLLTQERKAHYAKARRTFYQMNSESIYKMILEYNEAMRRERGEVSTEEVTKEQAIRAWNMSIMFYRPFVLAPSSFDKAAPAYYAFRPDYALGEIEGGTSNISPLMFFSILGFTSNHPDRVNTDTHSNGGLDYNPLGVVYTLDAFQVQDQAHGILSKIAKATIPKNIRHAIHFAFDKKGVDDKYYFLRDLPIAPLPVLGISIDNTDPTKPKKKGSYRAFIDPLSNMVVRDNNGTPKRFPVPAGSGISPDSMRFMTFADYIDSSNKNPLYPSGMILWEELPFSSAGVSKDSQQLRDQYSWWVNQAKNITAFYNDVLTAKPDAIAREGLDKMAALAKDIKYVTALLEPYGLEIEYGKINGNKLKRQLVLTVAFVQGAMMMALEHKSINEVKQKFSQYNLDISAGEKEMDANGNLVDVSPAKALKEGLDAVFLALEAGFQTAALTREFVANFAKQVEKISFYK